MIRHIKNLSFQVPVKFKLLGYRLSLVTFFISVATGFCCNLDKIIFQVGVDFHLCTKVFQSWDFFLGR